MIEIIVREHLNNLLDAPVYLKSRMMLLKNM